MKTQLAGTVVLSLLLSAVPATAAPELPEGKGKDVVENTCTDCHSLKRIEAQRLNEEGWNNIVREMIENGASINPDDIKIIVTYLAQNFGPDNAKPGKEKKADTKSSRE